MCYTYHSMSAIHFGWFLYRTMNIIIKFVKICIWCICMQCRPLDLWACNWWLFSREPSTVEDVPLLYIPTFCWIRCAEGWWKWRSPRCWKRQTTKWHVLESYLGIATMQDNGGESGSLVRMFVGPLVSKKMESSWHITEHCFSHLFPLSCCPQLWLNCLNLVLPSFINITMDR